MAGKIIKIAESKGKKYKLILKEDNYLIKGIQNYSIDDYTNNKITGQFDVGSNKKYAIKQLMQMIKDWNKYNTKLGKLYMRTH